MIFKKNSFYLMIILEKKIKIKTNLNKKKKKKN